MASGHGFSLELLRIVDGAGIAGIWELDIASDRVVSNAAMAQLYRVDGTAAAAGVSPAAFREAIHGDDVERAVDTLRSAIQNASDYRTRYRVIDAQGKHRFIEVRAKPLIVSGQVIRMSGFNVEVPVHSEPDTMMQLADHAIKAAALAAELQDRELTFFTQMLLMTAGARISAKDKAGRLH